VTVTLHTDLVGTLASREKNSAANSTECARKHKTSASAFALHGQQLHQASDGSPIESVHRSGLSVPEAWFRNHFQPAIVTRNPATGIGQLPILGTATTGALAVGRGVASCFISPYTNAILVLEQLKADWPEALNVNAGELVGPCSATVERQSSGPGTVQFGDKEQAQNTLELRRFSLGGRQGVSDVSRLTNGVAWTSLAPTHDGRQVQFRPARVRAKPSLDITALSSPLLNPKATLSRNAGNVRLTVTSNFTRRRSVRVARLNTKMKNRLRHGAVVCFSGKLAAT